MGNLAAFKSWTFFIWLKNEVPIGQIIDSNDINDVSDFSS